MGSGRVFYIIAYLTHAYLDGLWLENFVFNTLAPSTTS